jgi:hypothetical protein
MKEHTMKTLAAGLVIAFALVVSGDAFAQNKGKGKDPKGAAKVKQYDFSGDTIDGELVKPEGEFVNTRTFAEHTSLIRVRADFIKEIVKSAEDR